MCVRLDRRVGVHVFALLRTKTTCNVEPWLKIMCPQQTPRARRGSILGPETGL